MENGDTIRKLTFEGPISIGHLVLIGAVVAVLTAVLTWRDCRAAGSIKLFFVLFLLRSVALVTVLWMLAGPSMVTLSRNARPDSVVVMVDGSASMDTVDPPDGSGNTASWSAMDIPSLEKLDQICGNLRAAQSTVNRIRGLIRTDDAGRQAQAAWTEMLDTVDAAAADLAGVRLDGAGSAEAARIAALLKSGAGPLRGERMSISHSAARSVRRDLNGWLEEAETFLASGLRRTEALSHKLAIEEEQKPGSQEKLAVQSRLTRKDKVANWLALGEESWLKEAEKNSRVLRYTFASGVQPMAEKDWRPALNSTAGAGSTDLAAALGRASDDASRQSVRAVVLVTDGGHNTAGDPRDAAASLRGVPLYVVPIGDSKMPRDVIVHHTHAPRAVFKNDMIVVESMVTAYGCEGEVLQAELLSDGAVVETQTNMISSAVYDQRLTFRQKAGDFGHHKLQVRVAPLHDEHSIDNNEGMADVEVMEDVIRVLLADARPRWEFRYLANLFKRDKHVDFSQLLFEPNDDPSEHTARPSFPTDLEGWRKYRVIIIGDVSPEELSKSQQEMLKKYVTEEGGTLIVIGGEIAMPSAFAEDPVGAMIPVTTGAADNHGLALAVTAEGSVSAATQLDDDPLASERVWRDMSGTLPIYLPARAVAKPTGHVLIAASAGGAGSEQQAFLSWQYVGLGRVIYIAAPVTYQLRYRNGDGYHHRFWGQLLRWAIAREMSGGSKTVRITTDKTSYESGNPAQVVVHLSEADGKIVSGARLNIEARQDDKVIKQVELKEEAESPGTYDATLNDLPAGTVTLRAIGSTVDALLAREGYHDHAEQAVTIDPRASGEQNSPVCNLALLKQLADASGGAVVAPAAVPRLLARANSVPEMAEAVLRREPVWNLWIYLWIFTGCVTFEWLARRYARMI
jgi:hypothetical protein